MSLNLAIFWLILSKSRHMAFSGAYFRCLFDKFKSTRVLVLFTYLKKRSLCCVGYYEAGEEGGAQNPWSRVFSFNNQTLLSCQHWPMRGQTGGETGQWEALDRERETRGQHPTPPGDKQWFSSSLLTFTNDYQWKCFLKNVFVLS